MLNATPLARARPITGLASLWRSTIGKKYVMAITGLIWFGYLIVHLWGNLNVYAGPVFLNTYGDWLRIVGEPFLGYSQFLWLARIILIPAFVVHVWAAVQLTSRDRASRPRRYDMRKNLESTFASRTMIFGGIFILLFLIYHLLDFTFGTVNPSYQPSDIYHNVVASFQRWPVVVFYELAMIAVGLHLFHGIWSTFQTLGWNTARITHGVRNVATVCAVLLTLGNMSIPLAVLSGIVG
ncbi:MAG: succinate dehydrogenase cytochrome b subunit [Chloroflexi bacterium]|nr:succinate dehydrogenase cytochrome b subunit [Chloroflexota bacterium]MBV9598621.1 succinate dehydrogenase cytochrome b subunit [Chloroflexota bacterium]